MKISGNAEDQVLILYKRKLKIIRSCD